MNAWSLLVASLAFVSAGVGALVRPPSQQPWATFGAKSCVGCEVAVWQATEPPTIVVEKLQKTLVEDLTTAAFLAEAEVLAPEHEPKCSYRRGSATILAATVFFALGRIAERTALGRPFAALAFFAPAFTTRGGRRPASPTVPQLTDDSRR